MPDLAETLALIIAGLGFFFIGIGGLKTNLQQLANRKFRRLVAGWMKVPGLKALWGFVFGAITQSATVVTFIVSGFVSGGVIKLRTALPVVAWANIGTTVLVFVAAIDIKVAALYLIGVSSIAVTFNFASKHKALLSAFYDVGLLFFGLRTMREAFGYLPSYSWFPDLLRILQGSELAAFFVGALLRLFIQSSSAIVVLAIAFTTSGLLTAGQATLLTFGTGLGVAGAAYMLSGNLRGVPKQIVVFQMGMAALASIVALALVEAGKGAGISLVQDVFQRLPGDTANDIACAYLALQIMCLVLALMFSGFAPRLLARISPVTPDEDIATPLFLLDEALADIDTALDLVDKEQQRFLTLIPTLLSSSRQSAEARRRFNPDSTHHSLTLLAREIRASLLEVLNRGLAAEPSEIVLRLDRRQGLVEALEENCYQLSKATQGATLSPELRELEESLIESLDSVFLVASDVYDCRDADDIQMLLGMTMDRGDMMKAARASLLESHQPLDNEHRAMLFRVTALFERLVWLVHQFAVSLDEPRPVSAAA